MCVALGPLSALIISTPDAANAGKWAWTGKIGLSVSDTATCRC